MSVYLWWWPADEAVNSPNTRQKDLYALVVDLATERGAPSDVGFMEKAKLIRRQQIAKAFGLVAQECVRVKVPGVVGPVNHHLVAIQQCVQQRTSGDIGESRGILVVRH